MFIKENGGEQQHLSRIIEVELARQLLVLNQTNDY